MPEHFETAIIGSGFAGLGMAIRLKREGTDDFVLFEKEDDVGGTWYVNTYPGCQCDIPTQLYSYSFARNPNWSRLYPLQEEILRYIRACRRIARLAASRHGCHATGGSGRLVPCSLSATASDLPEELAVRGAARSGGTFPYAVSTTAAAFSTGT